MANSAPAVLIFGGSGGLGSVICLLLAQRGFDIALSFKSGRERAEAVAASVSELGRQAICGRVVAEDRESVAAFVARAKHVLPNFSHVVYASGPHLDVMKTRDVGVEEYSSCIDADVKGFFNIFKSTITHLSAIGGGSYVALTTSAVGRYIDDDATSAVPKAAVQQLVRAIAREEGVNRIRANCVAPGVIDAGLVPILRGNPQANDIINRVLAAVPMRRMGSALDVAEAVAFLLSDKAGYISGQSLYVDGGFNT
jgi:NAD(P)-dependent dehydrogenase (short-subunit alcohol dehydrogenase family)